MAKYINLEGAAQQSSLFSETSPLTGLNPFPRVDYGEAAVAALLDSLREGDELGLDYEFKSVTSPTVIGIATPTRAAACFFTKETHQRLHAAVKDKRLKLVAYSTMGADKPVYDHQVGYSTPDSWWEDGMIAHWCANSHLCKSSDREEGDDAGSFGFMDLWTATSLVRPGLMNWKQCRGAACSGKLCPKHDVLGYCALDAWGGLIVWQTHKRRIALPYYRMRVLVSDLAHKRQEAGIAVNLNTVRNSMGDAEKRIASLFPPDAPFNHRSPSQIIDWFGKNGLNFRSATKGAVEAALRIASGAEGFTDMEDMLTRWEDGSLENHSEKLEWLIRLRQAKVGGKGMDAWFGPKYVRPAGPSRQSVVSRLRGLGGPFASWEGNELGYAHPRFNSVGTAFGRFSSSGPNFQNIPTRGWGVTVKSAIIPRWLGGSISDSDLSQLELRNCLYLAGFDLRELPKDAFMWLVAQAEADFADAALMLGGGLSPRDVAKTWSHAANYLEGIQLYSGADLDKPKIKDEIALGAIRIHKNWKFEGRTVGFDAKNLAKRSFGNDSIASRRKALDIVEGAYKENFPKITQWHMAISDEIERTGRVSTPDGWWFTLYGTARDRLKAGAAACGQHLGSTYALEGLLRVREATGSLFLIQVHDSQVHEHETPLTAQGYKDFYAPMYQESTLLPGFICPGNIKAGPTYALGKQHAIE